MEIVQVAGLYPPHLGGEEIVVETLARAQAAAGHHVTVLTSDVGCPTGTPRHAVEHGVQVHRLRARSLVHTPLMPEFIGRLLGHRPRPDVVHLHAGHAVLAEQVMLICLARRIPYVVHVHLLVRPSSRVGTLLLPLYERLLFGVFLRRAARVICLTAAMRDELVHRHRLDPARVVVVPNGTDTVTTPEVTRRRNEVLFVGRLTPQKNVLALVDAMALATDLRLRIVGEGELQAAVEQRIATLRLDNVELLGRLEPPQVQLAYRQATVLAMPSTHEGMPLVLLEAMAAGLPVVAAPIPELMEFGGAAVHPLAGMSPSQIAEALRRVAADPSEQERLRAAGRDLAARHSWAATAERVEDAYRAVLTSAS